MLQATPTTWPTEVEDSDSTDDPTPTIQRKPRIPPWFFTLLCMFLVTTTSGTPEQHKNRPMLCQSHAAPMVYSIPNQYNCSFQLLDNKPGPDKATLQLFKRNIIKYSSLAKLCTRIETTVRRLTYFAAISHREETLSRHIPVSQTECQSWINSKLSPDGPLVYTNHIWKTQKCTNTFWPSVFQCCSWYTFKANNSIIFEGTVIKDHFHSMHSNLGKWSQCNYTKGTCMMEDGSTAIWQVKKSEACPYIPHKNITGKIWDSTFLSNDNNLALTFQKNKTFSECNYNQLITSHQGIPFQILDIQDLNANISKIRNGQKQWTKRSIHTTVGMSDHYTMDIYIVNISTNAVPHGIIHRIFKYDTQQLIQIYLLHYTFYDILNNIIDPATISSAQIQLRTHRRKSGRHNEWQYGIVFDKFSYPRNLTCSLVFLTVRKRHHNPPTITTNRHARIKRATMDGSSIQTDTAYITVQIQAVAIYAKTAVHHAYLQALHSVCHSMNNVL